MLKLAFDGIIGFSDVPLRLALWSGTLVSLSALLYGTYATLMAAFGANLVSGWASTITLVSFLAGINLLMTGIVGVYVGRIHTEVKHRPLYVVGRAVGFPNATSISPVRPAEFDPSRQKDRVRTAALLSSVAATPVRRASGVESGAAASAIVLLALFIGLIATSALLNDPDTQWHIAVGHWIWAAGHVPSTDVFFAHVPGRALDRQGMGIAADPVRGLPGRGAGAASWFSRRWRSHAPLPCSTPGCGAAFARRSRSGLRSSESCWAAPHFLARPHILVLPVIVLWMMALVAAREKDKAPTLPLALLMAVWANMHASFPLGLMMAGVLAGEGVLAAPVGSRIRRLWQWSLFLAPRSPRRRSRPTAGASSSYHCRCPATRRPCATSPNGSRSRWI